MNILRFVSRLLVGLVFIFSGFVKAVDPVGTAVKFKEYFEAFGMGFFSNISLFLAIVLIALEFIVGMVMLLGIRMKFFSWVLLILMSYFFVLTFIIAITNPVTDCGCFGDFLVISNWGTFYKNIGLMAFSILIFWQRNNFKELYNRHKEWIATGIITLAVFWFSIYNIVHLPVFDFRPYHVGSHIPSGMELPEGAPVDEYEVTLIYEKDGEQKEFDINDPEWQDGSWTYVDRKEKLVKKGYEPPIHDFVITNNDGDEITDNILYNDGYSFLFISSKINQKKVGAYREADKIKLFCDQDDWYTFYAVTSALDQDIQKIKTNAGITFDFNFADETMLKTMIRSKPGLVLIKSGTIIGKWHYNDFPDVNELGENYLSDMINKQRTKGDLKNVFIYILSTIILIVFGRLALKRIHIT